MNMDATELLFLRLSLANAYDQQDQALVDKLCVSIDALAIEKTRRCLKALEESVS